jgi:glycosyltransferase involved in cell wall biosynthesis
MLGISPRSGKESPVTLADRARDIRQWDNAARYYQQALHRKPDNPPIWVQYGHALKESGHLADAERAYRKALELAPDVADTYLQLGHSLKIQGRKDEATACYLRAFALDPALHDATVELVALGWAKGCLASLETDQVAASKLSHCIGREKAHLKFDDGCIFDDRLYRKLYETELGSWADNSNGIALYYHYLTIGRAKGFSPHLHIDEDWYRSVYPDVSPALQTGKFRDCFGHYFNVGADLGFSPSDDFDEQWYRQEYPEVETELRAGRVISGYQHYLLLDLDETRDPNPYFSEAEYRRDHPAVRDMISAGRYRSGFHHFCENGRKRPRGADYRGGWWLGIRHRRWSGILGGSHQFADSLYLTNNPDVVVGIREGRLESACSHWLTDGVVEDLLALRARVPGYNETLYLRHNPDISALVDAGTIPSGYHHFLMHGYVEGRAGWSTATKATPLIFDFPALASRLDALLDRPLISIIVPVFDTQRHQRHLLKLCIESVRRQIYPNWELCIVDNGSTRADTRDVLIQYSQEDKRIRIGSFDLNRGIAEASNAALALASGTWVALVDHDDELTPDALLEVASAIVADPDLELIYSDEDKISSDGEHRYDLTYKPGWSPELLRSTMYIGHLTVYKKLLIDRLGGFRSEFDGTQDYDLALRASEVVTRVHHIPKILYHWRASCTSSASDIENKNYTLVRQKTALEAALLRTGARGRVLPVTPGNWHVAYAPPTPHPLVSIVIPTAGYTRSVAGRRFNLLRNCVQSLIDSECYDNFEVVVVDNGDLDRRILAWLEQLPQVRLVHFLRTVHNFSEKVNLGVEEARGEYVLLLNDDTEVITPRFLYDMVGMARQPDIGAVGAKLLFPEGRIQHVGIIIKNGGPAHALVGEHASATGPQRMMQLTHNAIGATAACLLVKRDVYRDVGGFNENLPVNYNDVDFCFKLRQRGLRIVIDPEIQLYHFEALSKIGTFSWELQWLLERWRIFDDPYVNPNFKPSSVLFEARAPGERSIGDFGAAVQYGLATRRPDIAGETVFFSIILGIYNTPERYLRELEETIFNQFYQNFEWIIVDDRSTNPETVAWFVKIDKHERVKTIRHEQNGGIMAAYGTAFRAAAGDYVVPVDHDDFLTLDALSIMAEAIRMHNRPAVLYSDECKSNPASHLFGPFHKPDWDPILFSNICYCCHLGCVRRDIAAATGCFEDRTATWSYDWDYYWRIYRAGHVPVHVPEITYAWRINPGSTASLETSAKPEAAKSQSHVLRQQLALSGWGKHLDIVENELFSHGGMWRLRPKPGLSVRCSVVVDVKGRTTPELISLVHDLITMAEVPRVWLMTRADTGDIDRADRVLSYLPDRRRISLVSGNDIAGTLRSAAEERSDFVAWIGPRTYPMHDSWLIETTGLLATFDDAMVAGGRVIGPDHKVIWAGGYFGLAGFLDTADFNLDIEDGGYHGMALCQRSVDGVPSVHWVVQSHFLSSVIELLPADLAPAALAAALALRAASTGRRVIYTPFNVMKTTQAVVRPAVPTPEVVKALDSSIPTASRYYNAKLSSEPEYYWVPRCQIM